jgi:hypothetical protein
MLLPKTTRYLDLLRGINVDGHRSSRIGIDEMGAAWGFSLAA